MPSISTAVLLAHDLRHGPPSLPVRADRRRRGAVTARLPGGGFRRAEAGPAGPLVVEVRPVPDGLMLEVWGPRATPAETGERALAAAAAWAGVDDDLTGFAELLAAHPLLARLARRLPDLRLSRVPRLAEAFGRAVLGQLVQGVEAARSIAQVAALAGTATGSGLHTWPTAAQLGRIPAWTLRRCGVSLRGAGALHAGCVHDRRLTRAADARDWPALDRILRALPGVGPWTSAETRLALGDADAVSVGDYHLPGLIGHVLGDGPVDDHGMLELLAPYAPHRGRVIRMVEHAVGRGLVAGPARRAPRAALSAHRYW